MIRVLFICVLMLYGCGPERNVVDARITEVTVTRVKHFLVGENTWYQEYSNGDRCYVSYNGSISCKFVER